MNYDIGEIFTYFYISFFGSEPEKSHFRGQKRAFDRFLTSFPAVGKRLIAGYLSFVFASYIDRELDFKVTFAKVFSKNNIDRFKKKTYANARFLDSRAQNFISQKDIDLLFKSERKDTFAIYHKKLKNLAVCFEVGEAYQEGHRDCMSCSFIDECKKGMNGV